MTHEVAIEAAAKAMHEVYLRDTGQKVRGGWAGLCDEHKDQGKRLALAGIKAFLAAVEPSPDALSAAVKLCDVDGGPCCDYTGVWPKAVWRAMCAALSREIEP